jgi:hypothetical protein
MAFPITHPLTQHIFAFQFYWWLTLLLPLVEYLSPFTLTVTSYLLITYITLRTALAYVTVYVDIHAFRQTNRNFLATLGKPARL